MFHPDWSLNYTASANNIIFSVRQFDDYWILGLRGVISVDFGVKHSVTTGIIPTVLLRWKERTGCRRRSKYDMSKTQNPRVSQATKTGFLIQVLFPSLLLALLSAQPLSQLRVLR